ncbi:DUF2207 domain-containing protein [Streptosporangium sp. NBC_01755]|uniref:DUF2207 domain-containing protein n=1 Tax=unclassified Streptosporangium TaxID=2632669 RepID=UPI002DDA9C12|nr:MULTISPECIES: DUF2207 domain-containing protein [unclassified Streptosporangium]WSA24548.1 DUF2207 domain-containing protein [Streptosporangium sp. NBC_01810]WSC97377.1 DUF2207 domain-containing protein [Streptosporangium sp. NBC_01755]
MAASFSHRAVGSLAATAILALTVSASPALATGSASPQATPDGKVTSTTVQLELRQDGVLHVREEVTFEGDAPSRDLVDRTRYDDRSDRLYQVTDLKGDAVLTGDVITLKGTGSAVLEYDVKGTITPLADTQELRWYAVGGWSVPVELARVTVSGPAALQSLSCFAGPLTSAIACTEASMDHMGVAAEFGQQGLDTGEVLTVVVGYPAAASKGAPILARRFELSNAFTLNTVTGCALAALLFLMLGGLALLYWTRGRDARVVGHESGSLSGVENGHFAPPAGVRPGQIGTLMDEQADVLDVTATIVDLAVRGYLRIDEQPRQTYETPDWRLVRLPATQVASLMAYELELYDAIFDGRDTVLLSELRGSFGARLGKVREALYRDVVKQGWFARRPDTVRTRWTTLGGVLTVLGVLATLALAWLTSYGLLGLALIIAGAALAVGGQYMPAKTAKGSGALAHTLGFKEYLTGGDIGDDVPEAQRVELFSRYLPYAVIFDSVDRWARVVSSVTGDGQKSDNLYWYHGPAEWDLSRFADSMRTFTMTTSGAISTTRRLRSV